MTPTLAIDKIKRLWKELMPTAVSPLDDYKVYLWAQRNFDDVTYAIERTAEKMHKNVRDGAAIPDDAAQRYTTSIIASRTKWRKERDTQGGHIGTLNR